jgi:hypothetical protein
MFRRTTVLVAPAMLYRKSPAKAKMQKSSATNRFAIFIGAPVVISRHQSVRSAARGAFVLSSKNGVHWARQCENDNPMSRRVPSWLLLIGGICLVVAGFLTLRQQAIEQGEAIGRVLATYSTVDDPNNPLRVEIEEWWGQHGKHTIFRRVGGSITFHPPPGFDWKKTQDEISTQLAWIGWVAYFLAGLGGPCCWEGCWAY